MSKYEPVVHLKWSAVYCGRCGDGMKFDARSIQCMNPHCDEKGVKYKHPAIKIERLED